MVVLLFICNFNMFLRGSKLSVYVLYHSIGMSQCFIWFNIRIRIRARFMVKFTFTLGLELKLQLELG